MEHRPAADLSALETLPRMPGWTRGVRGGTLEEAAFQSGAVLALVHQAVGRSDVPQPLWRARLALGAAGACVALAGRPERAAELRDAVHLLRPGDRPGPAGEVLMRWTHAVMRPVSGFDLGAGLVGGGLAGGALAGGAVGSPVARAAAVLEAMLIQAPQDETAALILGDAVLARALGWGYVMPLLAVGLTPRDLRRKGEGLRLACHRSLATSGRAAVQMAAELALRAGRLRAVAPRLRAKGAAAAVALFETRDALTPVDLMGPMSGPMSGRAARRLCDRLVALGAVRELTGRDSFRLYGV